MALPGSLVRPWRQVRRWLPPCNFITLHYAYFVVTCMIASVIFWGASTPAHSVRYIDALFLVVSAMTLSGLGSINLSIINTFQQIMLFVLIMMGSAIFVSAFVVHLRKRAFEKKFRIVVEKRRQKDGTRRRTTSLHELSDLHRQSANSAYKDVQFTGEYSQKPLQISTAGTSSTVDGKDRLDLDSAIIDGDAGDSVDSTHLTFSRDTRFRASNASQVSTRRRSRLSFGTLGVGVRPGASLDITSADDLYAARSINHFDIASDSDKDDPDHYFDAAEGWTSRNSQFHGLTERERERLGGYEYRAVALLAWLVPAYYVLFQLLGCLGCAAWVAYNRPDTARGNGLDPWWLGAFNAVSAFSESMQSLCIVILELTTCRQLWHVFTRCKHDGFPDWLLSPHYHGFPNSCWQYVLSSLSSPDSLDHAQDRRTP
jgi:hypothetical protein